MTDTESKVKRGILNDDYQFIETDGGHLMLLNYSDYITPIAKARELEDELDRRTSEIVIHGGMALACSAEVKSAFESIQRDLEAARRERPMPIHVAPSPSEG